MFWFSSIMSSTGQYSLFTQCVSQLWISSSIAFALLLSLFNQFYNVCGFLQIRAFEVLHHPYEIPLPSLYSPNRLSSSYTCEGNVSLLYTFTDSYFYYFIKQVDFLLQFCHFCDSDTRRISTLIL